MSDTTETIPLAAASTAVQQSNHSLATEAQRRATTGGSIASATKTLIDGSVAAAKRIVDISVSGDDREALAASRDILDRVGVGKAKEAPTITVDTKFLSMALVGIAALAGRDVSGFGDMTDLQDKLADLNREAVTADFEEIDDNE